MIWTLQKCNKKIGSPYLFTHQQALKMVYFYWLHVTNSDNLHWELSLGYLKDTKFYLESKASFIHITSIASFKLLLIAWLWEYCTFRMVPWLAWSPCLGQNTSRTELFSKKNHVLLSNFFFFFKYVLIRLFLANTWKKNRGVTHACLREKEHLFCYWA